jgi:hypothetical protein
VKEKANLTIQLLILVGLILAIYQEQGLAGIVLVVAMFVAIYAFYKIVS